MGRGRGARSEEEGITITFALALASFPSLADSRTGATHSSKGRAKKEASLLVKNNESKHIPALLLINIHLSFPLPQLTAPALHGRAFIKSPGTISAKSGPMGAKNFTSPLHQTTSNPHGTSSPSLSLTLYIYIYSYILAPNL